MAFDFEPELTDTYDIIGEIGQGGGGTVFEAYHRRLRKKVVIKKQHDSIRGLVDERTETDTLKNLRHSNLPQVLDFIVTEKAVYTVMDYIPGRSVKEILMEEGKIDENTVITYAKQLCDALIYLHNSNPPVIHGDIKPDNIMITPDGDVCLIDFNISSALGETNRCAFGYSLGYAAPEQRRAFEYERDRISSICDKTEIIVKTDHGDRSEDVYHTDGQIASSNDLTSEDKAKYGILFDKRSDIYSFGATLYHMLTGIKPLSDPNEIVSILEILPGMNRGLAVIITRSMYPDPSDRFQCFEEIKSILDHIKRYDIAYRARVIKRIVLFAAVAVAAGILIASGLTKIRENNEIRFDEKLNEALDLYYAMKYEQSIDKINDELLDGNYWGIDKVFDANAYYLRGNDWMELKEYDLAVMDYDTALKLYDNYDQVYLDKIIALAKSGRTTEALELIEDAKSKDIEKASLLLAQAEIEISEGKIDDAIHTFNECVGSTDDNEIKARAYMLCSDLYDRTDRDSLNEAIVLLEKASVLNSGLQAGVLQRLAQCYLDQAEITCQKQDYYKALDVFTQIIQRGWDTYTTHNNIVIIYTEIDELEKAIDELNIMLDKYGDNYNTYKRLAFVEIELQNDRSNNNGSRDYSACLDYAHKAFELYKNQNIVSEDMEMDVLEALIEQIEINK